MDTQGLVPTKISPMKDNWWDSDRVMGNQDSQMYVWRKKLVCLIQSHRRAAEVNAVKVNAWFWLKGVVTRILHQKCLKWTCECQNWMEKVEEGGLVWWMFFLPSWGGQVNVSLTWERDGTSRHYGKKSSRWGQCDAFGNVLLVNTGSCRSCRCYFDMYHLSKHCCWSWTPLHGNYIPWCKIFKEWFEEQGLWYVLEKQVWSIEALIEVKRSAADILMPDTSTHLVESGQNGFNSTRGNYTILGRCFNIMADWCKYTRVKL